MKPKALLEDKDLCKYRDDVAQNIWRKEYGGVTIADFVEIGFNLAVEKIERDSKYLSSDSRKLTEEIARGKRREKALRRALANVQMLSDTRFQEKVDYYVQEADDKIEEIG